jgi:transposase
MKKNDGRRMDHQTLEEIRIRAIQQIQAGVSQEKVIKTLNFSCICIYNWMVQYKEGYWEGLKAIKLNGGPPK